MFFRKKSVLSLESLTLTVTGMRSRRVYRAHTEGGRGEVALYDVRYVEKKDEYQLLKRADCSADELTALCTACRLLCWDGFSGKHPRGVLDGVMFSLNAVVNGEKNIRASGSENFPKGYREFVRGLDEILNRADG